MKTRCYNSNYEFFDNYGGRGITVCDRWRNNFKDFIEDMGERPEGEYSIERLDNDGNYEPSNCKWADRKEQANNRRNNLDYLTHDGKTLSVLEWSELLTLPLQTIYARMRRGYPISDVLSTETVTLLYCDGDELTVKTWSEKSGISVGNINIRLKRGWSIPEALGFSILVSSKKAKEVTLLNNLKELKLLGTTDLHSKLIREDLAKKNYYENNEYLITTNTQEGRLVLGEKGLT